MLLSSGDSEGDSEGDFEGDSVHMRGRESVRVCDFVCRLEFCMHAFITALFLSA